MIPTLLAVSGMGIFALALLTSVLSTKRSANHMADDYRLASSVESVAMLGTEALWSGYLADPAQAGVAGSIDTFRTYLNSLGIADSGPGGAPGPEEGFSLLPLVGLPVDDGESLFQAVTIDALQIVRRDDGDATQLYLTVSASTNRGKGLVNPVLNRAVQQVYTVEPEDFDGFDFAVLANNVNCIFCHTNIDSVERFYNADSDSYDSFDRVRVGALETVMLRHMSGAAGPISDFDSDSFIAGTLYVRGDVTDQDGHPLGSFSDLAFQGYDFDTTNGKLIEDAFGELVTTPFSPAGSPPAPMENLYLDYPEVYADMVDGAMPTSFPSPIPDDGGIDPMTGLPDPAAKGNKLVDDLEFDLVSETAEGAITAGIIGLVPDGEKIDDVAEYAAAVFVGNQDSVQQTVGGNLILTGTEDNPITIDGTVAIDGDLIINGYIKGEGNLVVRGNIYVPTDLQYLDGSAYLESDPEGSPSGPRTFGVAQDGTKNAVGLAAGGNVLIGDYLSPSRLQPDLSKVDPEKYDIVSGDETDDWNFALAEMSLFNRAEWAKTQEYLPNAAGEADDADDPVLLNPMTGYPVTWVPNPDYEPNYVPRYYHFGEGDTVPIYNRGNIYFDELTGTWVGDAEVPVYWDTSLLTLADPDDPSDPVLFPVGDPAAVLKQVTPTDAWIPDDLYKVSIEYFEDTRPFGEPMAVDGLVYTNNSIFGIVSRITPMLGRMTVNGSLVASDLGLLVPGYEDPFGLSGNTSPLSDFAIGLQLNYDQRVKEMLNVKNPLQVQLKRTLWNPTANLL
ncbi:MAG: hypothetical protein AAF682_27140 [Planctomycetota bacterium]